MINNFEQIKGLLDFKSEDDFYFVQVFQRKKDNPGIVKGSNNNNRLIKAYYIRSLKHLEEYQQEMINLANLFNARVGINLNKRSFYKTAFNTLKKIAEQMHNKDFMNVKKAYNTSCGIHNGTDDKIWILDIDEDMDLDIIVSFIDDKCYPLSQKDLFGHTESKVLAKIPSKTGIHIIVKAFDLREFKVQYPTIEIHKNNPTNLYIP